MVTLRTQGNIRNLLNAMKTEITRITDQRTKAKAGGIYYQVNFDNKDEILEAIRKLEGTLVDIKENLKFES